MIRKLTFAAFVALCLPAMAASEGREVLGYGRLVNNDLIGDTEDRWHTGNVASSRVKGFGWAGTLPDTAFDILEYRFNGGIISPRNFASETGGDRPFAGYISLGLHTHFQKQGAEVSLGGDLVFVGPQTGMDDLQTFLHDTFDYYQLSEKNRDEQIANGAHPTLVAELGRSYTLTPNTTIRPFTEAQLGVESLFRLGADVTIGQIGQGELLVRDRITGQRYRTIMNSDPGIAFVLGADAAYVDSSVFLPETRDFELTDSRNRLRAGVHWQGERNAMYYGLTYHGEEFEGQSEGQLVGSLRLDFKF